MKNDLHEMRDMLLGDMIADAIYLGCHDTFADQTPEWRAAMREEVCCLGEALVAIDHLLEIRQTLTT